MTRRTGRLARWLLAGMLAGVCPAAVLAQKQGMGTLSGRVTDAQGGALPGVRVTLANPGTAFATRTAMTDIEGNYTFGQLPPGKGYELTATVPDYATVIAGGIELFASHTTMLNLTLLSSEESSEVIRVEAVGEVVDTSSTTTATQITSEFIEGTPLVGRRFTDLLTLAPGVTDTDGDGNPNVRGARDTGLQIRLDGSNVSNPLTGKSGQDINLETVQEVEIITAGASAEYGRTDGGFASVITKSGGNDFEGSFKLFHRSDLLDGSGAGAVNEAPLFNDTDSYLTMGGPIARDHLWYFASVERLDEQVPVIFLDGTHTLKSREGWRAFAKVTWQASADHKLAFQLNHDPLDLLGNNIGTVIDPQTDYKLRTGGPMPQLTWTAILSPTLLLQTVASYLDLHNDIEPISGDGGIIDVQKYVQQNGQTVVALPCVTMDCQIEPNLRRYYHLPTRITQAKWPGPLLEGGPYNVTSDQQVKRFTFRSDLSYNLEGESQNHAIKGGFESSLEQYRETLLDNPVLTDGTCEYADCPGAFGTAPPGTRLGTLLIQVYDPAVTTPAAESFNVGAYLQDSWKPRSNLTVNVGVRYDYSAIQSEGMIDFDPRAEAREVMRRYDIICDAAGSSCTGSRTPGRRDGHLGAFVIPPPGSPALKFDLNGDGVVDLTGVEGAQFLAPFTTRNDLVPEQFLIANGDVSPRLAVAWDPWADGKTKVYGSWGIYRDRLFLQSVTTGQQPVSYSASWTAQVNDQIQPGELSAPLPLGITLGQTGRDLRTPFTVEWTAGVEREFAPEWAVSLSYISRRGNDLLQDLDVNHITCKGFDTEYHVAPMAVCGDGGRLELDRFGSLVPGSSGTTFAMPNGAIDLYNLNPNFNQVLRVGNFNSSEYRALELALRRRLQRNWQMMLGYTYSRAFGQAESFTSLVGNDPAISDKVAGYLDYDQRHIVKWQTVLQLPRGLLLGGTVQWSSGLPFTYTGTVEDYDDTGNITPLRIYSVTGLRNDQRNRGQLAIDGRVEKRLTVGKTSLAAFLEAENILNSGGILVRQIDQQSHMITDGSLRFGRRWQIGFSVFF